MKNRLPLIITETAAIVLVLVAIIISFAAGDYENTQITGEDREITSGYLIDETHYTYNSLPVHVSAKKGTSVSVKTMLPADIGDDWSISFLALYSKCEVFSGGKLIGSYGSKLPLDFGRMVGNIRVIIPIPKDLAGSQIELVITPYYSVSMDISPIKIGPTGEIKYNILKANVVRIIMISILVTLIFTAAVILINQFFEKSYGNVRLFGNFILLVIFVTCWLYCSCDLPQLHTNANEAVSLISFLSLSCFTVPFAGFCEQMFQRRQRLFFLLQIAGWCIPILNVLLFVTNIADPMDILFLTHAYMIIVVILSVAFAFLEPQKTPETRFFLVGIVLLLIAAVGGFICYFIAPSKGYDGIWFGFGFIAFIASLFLLILSKQVSLIKERQNLDAYKHLAYSNVITGLSNRTAFDEAFASMQNRLNIGEPVTIYLAELFNHKSLVEKYGHQAGDNALRLFGQNLEKAFRNTGTCYHFGGDEFAVVIESTMVDVRKLKASFEELCSRTDFMFDAKLFSTIGYSTLPFETDPSFKDKLIDRATEALREEERRLKAIHGLNA